MSASIELLMAPVERTSEMKTPKSICCRLWLIKDLLDVRGVSKNKIANRMRGS